MLSEVPGTFVGPVSQLERVVRVLCREMAASFKAAGMELPPWREPQVMLSRWMPQLQEAPVSSPTQHQPAAAAQPQPTPLPSVELACGAPLPAPFPEPSGYPAAAEGEESAPIAAEGEQADPAPAVVASSSRARMCFVDLRLVPKPEASVSGAARPQTSSAGGARPQSFLQAAKATIIEPTSSTEHGFLTRSCISDPGSSADAPLLDNDAWPTLSMAAARPAPKAMAVKFGARTPCSAGGAKANFLDAARRSL